MAPVEQEKHQRETAHCVASPQGLDYEFVADRKK
jgi:hypothetical protein